MFEFLGRWETYIILLILAISILLWVSFGVMRVLIEIEGEFTR